MDKERNLIMVITLKNSGVQLRYPVTKYTVKKEAARITGLEWSWDKDASANLSYINADEIAAVHSEWE